MLEHGSGGALFRVGGFHPETVRYILGTGPGKRASLGHFSTLRSLRVGLLSRLSRLVGPKVLDPACGAGGFLLSARGHFVDPELYCWEARGGPGGGGIA